MVGKKSPREDLTRRGVHDRCDAVQEILAIRLRDEDSSTLDSSHHDMVESGWGVETWTARHVGSLSASEKDVNGSNGTTSPMARFAALYSPIRARSFNTRAGREE
jgi:hypothetical protein